MSNHKSEDFKTSAVEYYLTADTTQEEVCKIYKCSVRSLMRWVDKYETSVTKKKWLIILFFSNFVSFFSLVGVMVMCIYDFFLKWDNVKRK